ncbi:MAG: Protein GrpE [Microgenomates bacterium OLB22]|nr:MAG: Protein GrpE [Microgenomates bacterium OLB22]
MKEQVKRREDPRIAELESQVQQLQEQYLRAHADYQNLESRLEKQVADRSAAAIEALARDILAVIDDIDQAEKFVQDAGLALIKAKFLKVLEESHIHELDVFGKPFDPMTSECLEMVSGEKDIVTAVFQKGYRLGERIIRPAKVQVGSGVQQQVQEEQKV